MSSDNTEQEPVTFVDKRKIDPETGEVREADAVPEPLVGTGAAPQPDSVDEDGVEGELIEEAPSAEAVELAERTADLQRLQAEYANYRRRVERDRQSVIDNAKAAVVTDLLAVLDDLDRARSHGDLEASPLKSVADKLVSVMGKQNVVPFGVVGDPFDPSIHEAVQHEGDGHNPVVGSLFRQGYKLGDKVLRTAMVSVVDGSSEQEDK